MGKGSDGGGAGGARPTIGMPKSSGGKGDEVGFLTMGALGRVFAPRRQGTDSALYSCGRLEEVLGRTEERNGAWLLLIWMLAGRRRGRSWDRIISSAGEVGRGFAGEGAEVGAATISALGKSESLIEGVR